MAVVDFVVRDFIATITINRPEARNAMSPRSWSGSTTPGAKCATLPPFVQPSSPAPDRKRSAPAQISA
jgi:hypothetical protein